MAGPGGDGAGSGAVGGVEWGRGPSLLAGIPACGEGELLHPFQAAATPAFRQGGQLRRRQTKGPENGLATPKLPRYLPTLLSPFLGTGAAAPAESSARVGSPSHVITIIIFIPCILITGVAATVFCVQRLVFHLLQRSPLSRRESSPRSLGLVPERAHLALLSSCPEVVRRWSILLPPLPL
jgi:hypothetical protein